MTVDEKLNKIIEIFDPIVRDFYEYEKCTGDFSNEDCLGCRNYCQCVKGNEVLEELKKLKGD